MKGREKLSHYSRVKQMSFWGRTN